MTGVEGAEAGRGHGTCDSVAESLPFFLNGSLTASERQLVSSHLHDCASCRADLREAAWVWAATDTHPEKQLLVDYAEGRSLRDMPRSVFEEHLAACSTCRLAVEAAQAWAGGLPEVRAEDAQPKTIEAAPRRGGTTGWRVLALAAGILGVLALATIWSTVERSGRGGVTAASVQIVELFPQAGVRGEGAAGRPGASLGISPDRPLVLVLVPERPASGTSIRVVLFDDEGGRLGEVADVEVGEGGSYSVLLPSPLPASPSLIIRLVDGEDETEILGEYRLSLGS